MRCYNIQSGRTRDRQGSDQFLAPSIDDTQIHTHSKWVSNLSCGHFFFYWHECFLFFFCCYAATQLALQVQQERSQVVCSNREARKRLARGHSRNGPWTRWRHTHTHVDTKKRNRTKHISIDTQHEWTTPTRNRN